MLTQELTDWMPADDANINSLSRHAMPVLLTHSSRAFLQDVKLASGSVIFRNKLELCRENASKGLRPTPHQTLTLMRFTKLSSTRAGGKIGRHHYILLRLIPGSSCHLAKGWEETKKLKKQIP